MNRELVKAGIILSGLVVYLVGNHTTVVPEWFGYGGAGVLFGTYAILLLSERELLSAVGIFGCSGMFITQSISILLGLGQVGRIVTWTFCLFVLVPLVAIGTSVVRSLAE